MKKNVSRRNFITASAAGAVLQSAGQTQAQNQPLGANSRINFGVIGCGGRGTSHLRSLVERQRGRGDVRVIAVSDVYEIRKARAKDISNAEVYHDYREMLSDSAVDAVVIATPDHWHGKMALDALNAGKDVYLEKPMTHTIDEAKEVHQKVQETGLVLQVGSQYCSQDQWWRAKEAIEEGMIGHIIWAQGTYCRNSKEGEWNYYNIEEIAGPQNVDWNYWQGAARKHEWDPDRFFRFRKYWEYSGGIATDLLYHKLAPMLIPLGNDYPYRVSAGGGIWVQKDGRDVPDTFMFNADFYGQYSVNMPSSMANSVGVPDIIRGHYGCIYLNVDHIRIVPDEPFVQMFKDRYGRDEVVLQSRNRDDHMTNFIQCVKSRQKPTLDSELGYKTQIAISMSVDSYRNGETLFYDTTRQEVTRSMPKMI